MKKERKAPFLLWQKKLTFPVSWLLYMNDKGVKGKVQYEKTGKTQKETEM